MKLFMRLLFICFFLIQTNAHAQYEDSLKSIRPFVAEGKMNLDITSIIYAAPYDLVYISHSEYAIVGNVYKLKLHYKHQLSSTGMPGHYPQRDTVNLGVVADNVKEIQVEMYTVRFDTVYAPPSISVFLPLHTENISLTENDVKVFPNPNNGSFTISSSQGFKGDMYVLNMMGQVVYSEQINIHVPLRKQIILVGLSEGVYLLKLQNSDSEIVSRFNLIHHN
jgi:hypothetical protein